MTVAELLASTSKLRKVKYPDDVKIVEVKVVPYIGTKSLLVRAYVKGSQNKLYTTVVRFNKLRVEKDPFPGSVRVIDDKGQVAYVEPAKLNKTPVMVGCSCSDYYFTWAWYNYRKGAHYGRRPKPYVRKTTTRPPRNPEQVPGVCKHIIALFRALEQSGLLK